ncbi:ubiquinone biosynthesis accessory factor UbiJ [Pseudoxanthomonas spadix]|uniref:ubiquinone biosynthesis accessory factor UbiJ n=1 Tax=Pseudoxanthomonas spadix TaxID=415229 RepID=UPI000F004203|nr:SCP2 sterol-binding domain-containing protein [Pseudoxanthomonas spadix]MBP3975905.1 SCP2 sterol-binding domain-containing protein [Pseudoxanthomonas spadix]RMW97346.1 SCP2 domain-containing protein [Pseudoxanthomonas spadix]
MPPTPFDALKPLAGRALEAALNRAIALDLDTRDALAPLAGRRIQITVDSPPLALEIAVEAQRLHVGPVGAGEEPDLAVRSTVGGLLGQLPFFRRDDAPAPVGKLHVSGDADLARRLQTLAMRFDPDWQQPLVTLFGEVLGVQIAQGVRAALLRLHETGSELATSAAEYVTEESRDVVARAELEAFHDDVDVLRDDLERLAARLSRLAARA